MTVIDIVARLRAETDGATVNPDGIEAADEITRLRAELAAERARVQLWAIDAGKFEYERDALRALLREARDLLLAARGCLKPFYGADVRARIDALLNKGGGDE